MLPEPYWRDAHVTLYCGDSRALLPQIVDVDAIIADPPYATTSLEWDHWPDGWPQAASATAKQMWCFGSFRMFIERWAEFDAWTYAQEIVWEKHNGSDLRNDRFRRVHEFAVHFYWGDWRGIHKAPQFTSDATARTARRKGKPPHWGAIEGTKYQSEDGGPRLMRSVLSVRSCHGEAVHPVQKPEAIVTPLLLYSVPAGGLVLDPFAGSGTTLAVARKHCRRAIGIEAREDYCRLIVDRLAQKELAV